MRLAQGYRPSNPKQEQSCYVSSEVLVRPVPLSVPSDQEGRFEPDLVKKG